MLVLFVGFLILNPFPRYLPPDFQHGFLRHKQDFFYSGGYFVGFYAHIYSSPLALLCGALQLSRSLRERLPRLHRMLGRLYVVLVLCCVAPGGAILSTRAFGGWSTMLCFAMISVLTWAFTLLAWRRARSRQYAEHGRWMCRSYLLLCSAIALRLIHILLRPLDLEPTVVYQWSAWLSWVPSLAIFELANWSSGYTRRGLGWRQRRSGGRETGTLG